MKDCRGLYLFLVTKEFGREFNGLRLGLSLGCCSGAILGDSEEKQGVPDLRGNNVVYYLG